LISLARVTQAARTFLIVQVLVAVISLLSIAEAKAR